MYSVPRKEVDTMNGPTNGPDVRVDNSHVSSHFMRGQHDAPITQQVRADDRSLRLDTPVDGQGNVGPSTFAPFKK